MDPLPSANTEITQFFRQWLETFAGYVREVDYASARPLFHPDVLAFGTYNDVISGIDQWVAMQWDNVWPKTTDFRFVLEQTSVLASPDGMMATVIAPWTSTGYHPDGHPFPRPGRAFRGMPMVGCACIPTCRSTAAYRRRAMPIGGEGLEDRIQRSRDDRFWRKAAVHTQTGYRGR